jgi:hypothetical protein
MKVFIAYGGATGKQLAEQVRRWLPTVLPSAIPFFAPWDTAKGSRWRDVIDAQLQESAAAILCLTGDTLRRPWILFEAGAISQRSRSYPLLFEVPPDAIGDGPLEQYHATEFAHDDLLRLLLDLQELPGMKKRPEVVLRRAFERSWLKLQHEVEAILARQTKGLAQQVLGGWWERITSTEHATALSFLQIEAEPGGKKLRLIGTAYGRNGAPTAAWESRVVLADTDHSSMVYLWEGDRLAEPRGKRRGIGQITFIRSQAGRVDTGQGSFDDTDMVSIYLQKTFLLARANPREAAVMTGVSDARKAALVKRKLAG